MKLTILLQIIVSILLITSIVIQSSNTGLGSTWGGTSIHYRSKKGVEKIVLISSIILTFLFATLALINSLV